MTKKILATVLLVSASTLHAEDKSMSRESIASATVYASSMVTSGFTFHKGTDLDKAAIVFGQDIKKIEAEQAQLNAKVGEAAPRLAALDKELQELQDSAGKQFRAYDEELYKIRQQQDALEEVIKKQTAPTVEQAKTRERLYNELQQKLTAQDQLVGKTFAEKAVLEGKKKAILFESFSKGKPMISLKEYDEISKKLISNSLKKSALQSALFAAKGKRNLFYTLGAVSAVVAGTSIANYISIESKANSKVPVLKAVAPPLYDAHQGAGTTEVEN